MMKKHDPFSRISKSIILIIFLFLLTTSMAQVPTWRWSETANGSGEDYSKAVTTDTKGNSYITGTYQSLVLTLGTMTLNKTGFANIFIVKYGPDGKIIWTVNAGGTDDDGATAIAVDEDENVYITGYFTSPTLVLGSTTLTISQVGKTDAFVAKFDKDGKPSWAKSTVGIDDDKSNGVGVDAEGNVYISGSYKSPNILFGTTRIFTGGDEDIFIAKYNSDGDLKWAKGAGGKNRDYAKTLAVDAAGNAFISGDFRSPTISLGSIQLNNAGAGDVFVAKFDSTGKASWAKSLGGTSYEFANSISLDPSGNIAVVGYFTSSSLTMGGTTLNNAGDADIFILHLKSTGDSVRPVM